MNDNHADPRDQEREYLRKLADYKPGYPIQPIPLWTTLLLILFVLLFLASVLALLYWLF